MRKNPEEAVSYNGDLTHILAYIFGKATGNHIKEYAVEIYFNL